MSRSNIHDVPETRATFERQLDNGLQLKYQLSVLQQPERARACGMGAKSHADRRPVDPPPVVELRLFHLSADGGETDVTFQHNSNFFLYASLELARPVAHARGMPAPPPSPVLTGVPVSGMAYLDRPAPAGYFIFPDLSVRHEGRYRLRFALYEDTKEQQGTNDPHEPREYCVHRLDVKSRPFTVFSAKKFPGLAESTSLSRIVAEQGCRVRIRRDVRMRRRSDRPRGRDSEDGMDETALMRARRGRSEDYDMDEQMSQPPPPAHIPTQYRQPNTPYMHQQEAERKRSVSDAPSNPAPDTPRYSNGQYVPPTPSHSSYPPPASTPAPPAPQHSNGYAPSNHSIPPPAPAAQQYQPPPPSSQSYDHSRPQNGYSAPPPPPPPPAPHHGYAGKDSLSVPGQVQRRESVGDYASRRESDAGYHSNTQYRPSTPQPPPTHQQYGSHSYNSQQPQQQQYNYGPSQHSQVPPSHPQQQAASLPPMVRLPPISDALPAPPQSWNSQPPTPSTAAAPPPQPSTSYQPRPSRQAPPPPALNPSQIPTPSPAQFPSYYPDQNKYNPPTPAPVETSKKRQWGRVFNPAHTEGALRGGMRPDTESDMYGSDPFNSIAADNDDDSYDIGHLRMTYRRADGCQMIKELHGDV